MCQVVIIIAFKICYIACVNPGTVISFELLWQIFPWCWGTNMCTFASETFLGCVTWHPLAPCWIFDTTDFGIQLMLIAFQYIINIRHLHIRAKIVLNIPIAIELKALEVEKLWHWCRCNTGSQEVLQLSIQKAPNIANCCFGWEPHPRVLHFAGWGWFDSKLPNFIMLKNQRSRISHAWIDFN